MTTKYERLANTLRELIETNMSLGITRLPTEKMLCEQYKVSRQTVRQALSLLQKEGLIQKKRGSGSYPTGLISDSKKNHIALITAYNDEYIYPSLIHDIQAAFTKTGYQISLYTTENKISREREILSSLLNLSIRGLIVEGVLSALPNPNLDLYEHLKQNGVSIVFINSVYAELSGFTCVKDSNYSAAHTLVNYVLQHNHTQIGGIFQYDDMPGLERYQGYTSALRDAGIPINENHIAWFSSADLELLRKKQDTGFLLEFIRKQLKSCSAVICYNDEIAYWLIKELNYIGLRVPEDLSVTCIHYSYLNDLSPVRITALSHAPHILAMTVTDSLTKLMQGLPAESTDLPYELLIRNSVLRLNR